MVAVAVVVAVVAAVAVVQAAGVPVESKH